MRKIVFWIMLVIVIALAIILGMAARQHVSPKALVQNWFSHKTQVEETTSTGSLSVSPITTGSIIQTTGQLSDDDKAQVSDFLNSVVAH